MTDFDFIHGLRAGAKGAPLFVVLHGTGGDENQFLSFASQLLPDATVISPRGDVSERGAARFFKRTGEGVYDMADLARGTQKLVAFLAAKKAEHGAGEIIGFGYSNGANILANVMIEHPDLVSKAALLHPLIPFAPKASVAKSARQIMISAGEYDPICPAEQSRELIAYFKAQGDDVREEWHSGGHEIRPSEAEALKAFFAA
jgi:phospholipase/carboxylesterase